MSTEIVVRRNGNSQGEFEYPVGSGKYSAKIKLRPKDTRYPASRIEWVEETYNIYIPAYALSLHSQLLHEMGHALGLPHHNDYTCDAWRNQVADNPANATTPGEEASVVNWQIIAPTKDDIEAFAFRFGRMTRSIGGIGSTTGNAGTWTIPVSFAQQLRTFVPFSVSPNTTGYRETGSAIAFVNADIPFGTSGVLSVAYDSGSGYGVPERVGGAMAANTTYHKPAVAIGGGHIAVAWYAESEVDPSAGLFVATKSFSTGTWVIDSIDAPDPTFSEQSTSYPIGLTFNADAGKFVLTRRGNHLDGTLKTGRGRFELFSFSPYGSENADYQIDLGFNTASNRGYAAGKSTCTTRTDTSNTFYCHAIAPEHTGALRIYRYYFDSTVSPPRPTGDGEFAVSYNAFGDTDITGMASGTFLATRTQNEGYGHVFKLTGSPPTTASNFTQVDSVYFPPQVGTLVEWFGCNRSWCATQEYRVFWAR